MDTFMHSAYHGDVEMERDCDIQESYNEADEILLTNFDKEERPLYEKAIVMSGETTLFIREEAYTTFGSLLQDCNALCCTEHKDYSAFWRCFETVKETA